MGLDRHRNEPCLCKSGKKFKHCCLPNHYRDRARVVTSLAKKIGEKTAKYWDKRYKAVTNKPLNEPLTEVGND